MNDTIALSFDYPVYTKPGEGDGVFLTEKYKPYTNTLALTEQNILCGLYDKAEGKGKKSFSLSSTNMARTSCKFRADIFKADSQKLNT